MNIRPSLAKIQLLEFELFLRHTVEIGRRYRLVHSHQLYAYLPKSICVTQSAERSVGAEEDTRPTEGAPAN